MRSPKFKVHRLKSKVPKSNVRNPKSKEHSPKSKVWRSKSWANRCELSSGHLTMVRESYKWFYEHMFFLIASVLLETSGDASCATISTCNSSLHQYGLKLLATLWCILRWCCVNFVSSYFIAPNKKTSEPEVEVSFSTLGLDKRPSETGVEVSARTGKWHEREKTREPGVDVSFSTLGPGKKPSETGAEVSFSTGRWHETEVWSTT